MDRVLSLYPTAHKVEDALKRASQAGCQWDYRNLTFPRLVEALWRELQAAPAALTTPGERLAIEQALARSADAQSAGLIASAGVVKHLSGLIREFKSSALTPDDLRQAGAALERRDAARVAAIADVFARYSTILDQRGLADAHDGERAVLDMLHAAEGGGPRPRLLEGIEQLRVAEVYDFGLLQFMIVASLIRLVGDAQITIQSEPRSATTGRFPELTWNRFVSEESIADQVLPGFIRRDGRQGRLGFLLANVFTPGARPAPPADDGSVRVMRAPTREAEIEEICRSIRHAIERQPDPIAPDRIAVLASDLAPYAPILTGMFARYGVPLQLHYGAPLNTSAAITAALDILQIPLEGYPRYRIDRLLASPFIGPRFAACRDLLARSGYLDQSTRPLAACIRTRLDDSPSRAEPANALVLEELIEALRTLESPGTVADHAERFGAALAAIDFAPSFEGLKQAGATAWSEFERALDELAHAAEQVTPDRSINLDEFASLVGAAAADALVRAENAPGGAVRAMPVLDARGLDFDLVFVVGLNDGIFPRLHSEDPLLPDRLRVALNRPLARALRARLGRFAPDVLGPLLRTSRHRNSEDWFLFFLALSMPERAIVLSYPAADETGRLLARSPFADEVVGLLGGEEIEQRCAGHDSLADRDQCFSRSELLSYAATHDLLDTPGVTAGVAGQLASISQRIEVERQRERYLNLPTREDRDGVAADGKLVLADRWNGRVPCDDRLTSRLLDARWNAGAINELATCGFKFFARRLLGLLEPDDLDHEASAIETGELMHDVLRELFSELRDFRDRRATLGQASALLARIRTARRRIARDPDFFDIKWQTVERTIEEVVEFEVQRRAAEPAVGLQLLLEHELAFQLPDLRGLLTPRQAVDIAGRVDRLEFWRTPDGHLHKLAIFDYKTSRNADRYAKMIDPAYDFGRLDFQLALYLAGALTQFASELRPDTVIEGGYLVLRHRDKNQSRAFPRSLLEPDPHRAATDAPAGDQTSIPDRVVALVAGAVGGRFDVDPLSCDEFCPYRRVCRYRKDRPLSTGV